MPKNNKPRVVVDTNLFLSSVIAEKTAPYKLLQTWKKNKYKLIVSESLLIELEKVANREKIKKVYPDLPKKVNDLLVEIKLSAELVVPLENKNIPFHSRDPKDDFLLGLAIAGNADFLVTGDKDLLTLKPDAVTYDIRIMTATDFLSLL